MVDETDLENDGDQEFDDDLDLPDLGEGPGGEPNEGRTPVQRASGGFLEGARSSIQSRDTQRGIISNLLPSGYTDAYDVATEGVDTAKDLYDTAAEQIKPVKKDLKKIGRKFADVSEGIVPDAVTKKLRELSEKEEDTTRSLPTEEEQEEARVESLLTDIFESEQQQNARRDSQQEQRDIQKEATDQVRFEREVQQLDKIREGVSRLVGYQDDVVSRYQRRSLKLQYQHLFVAKNQFTLFEGFASEVKTQLDAIANNTSLPDFVKIQTSEALKQQFMESALGSIQDKVSGFLGQFKERAKGRVKELSSNFAEGVRGASDAIDSTEDTPIDGVEMAGSVAGGEATRGGLSALAQKLGGRVSRIPGVVRTGENLGFLASNRGELFRERLDEEVQGSERRREERNERRAEQTFSQTTGDGSFADQLRERSRNINASARDMAGDASDQARSMVAGFLQELMPNISPEASIGRSAIEQTQQAVPFTEYTDRSITEIIPNLLENILHETEMIRSGDSNIEKRTYDPDEGRLVRQSDMESSLSQRIFPSEQIDSMQERLEQVINTIDSDEQLSDDARSALMRQMIEDASRGRGFRPERFMSDRGLSQVDNEEDRQQIQQVVSNRFLDDQGQFRSGDDQAAMARGQASGQFQSARDQIPNYQETIRQLLPIYGPEVLQNAGLISNTDRVGERAINTESIMDRLAGRDSTSPLGTGQGPKAAETRSNAPVSPMGGESPIDSLVLDTSRPEQQRDDEDEMDESQSSGFIQSQIDQILQAIYSINVQEKVDTANNWLNKIHDLLAGGGGPSPSGPPTPPSSPDDSSPWKSHIPAISKRAKDYANLVTESAKKTATSARQGMQSTGEQVAERSRSTREQLQQRFSDTQNTVSNFYHQLREGQAGDQSTSDQRPMLSPVRDFVHQTKESIQNNVGNVDQRFDGVEDRVRGFAQNVGEQTRQGYQSAREKINPVVYRTVEQVQPTVQNAQEKTQQGFSNAQQRLNEKYQQTRQSVDERLPQHLIRDIGQRAKQHTQHFDQQIRGKTPQMRQQLGESIQQIHQSARERVPSMDEIRQRSGEVTEQVRNLPLREQLQVSIPERLRNVSNTNYIPTSVEDRIEQGRQQFQNTRERVQQYTAPKMERGRERAQQLQQGVQERVDRGRHNVQNVYQQTRDQVNRGVQSGGRQAVDTARQYTDTAYQKLQSGKDRSLDAMRQGIQYGKEQISETAQKASDQATQRFTSAREQSKAIADQLQQRFSDTQNTVSNFYHQLREGQDGDQQSTLSPVRDFVNQSVESTRQTADAAKDRLQSGRRQVVDTARQGIQSDKEHSVDATRQYTDTAYQKLQSGKERGVDATRQGMQFVDQSVDKARQGIQYGKEQISETAQKASDQATQRFTSAREQSKAIADQLQQQLGSGQQNVSNFYNQFRDQTTTRMEQAREQGSAMVDQLSGYKPQQVPFAQAVGGQGGRGGDGGSFYASLQQPDVQSVDGSLHTFDEVLSSANDPQSDSRGQLLKDKLTSTLDRLRQTLIGEDVEQNQGQGGMGGQLPPDDPVIEEQQQRRHQELLEQIRGSTQALKEAIAFTSAVSNSEMGEEAANSDQGVSMLRRIGRGVGSGLGGVASFYGNTFRAIGQFAGGAGRIGGGVLGGVGDRVRGLIGGGSKRGASSSEPQIQDIYMVGYSQPVLRARDLRQGRYFSQETGEPIQTLADIDSPVVDKQNNVILTAEEIAGDNLYTKDGTPLKDMLSGGMNMVSSVTNFATAPTRGMFHLISGGIGMLKSFFGGPRDVYVRGESRPRLLAVVLRNGGYFSQNSQKRIYSINDIDGPVVDREGNVVLSLEDMTRGLVDSRGKNIEGLADKAKRWMRGGLSLIGSMAGATMRAGTRIASGVAKASMGAVGGVAGALGYGKSQRGAEESDSSMAAGSDEDHSLTSLFQTANGHARDQVRILQDIQQLLSERIPPPENVREGGWRDLFSEQEKKDQSKEESQKGRKATLADKSKSIFGGAGGFLASLLGFGGEGDGGGFVSDAAAGAAGGAATGFLGKLKRGGGKLLRGVGSLFRGTGGLLRGAATLGTGLMSTGVMSSIGAGLASAGSMVATGLGTAAAGIGSVLSAPVVLGVGAAAALGVGAYLGYKYLTRDKSGPLDHFRVAQYGFDINNKDHEDAIKRCAAMEQFLQPYVESDSQGQAKLTSDVDVEGLLKEIGISSEDNQSIEQWLTWFRARFLPVYLTHIVAMQKLANKKDLSAVAQSLEPEEQIEYLKAVRFAEGKAPYGYQQSPFTKPMQLLGPDAVEGIYQKTKEKVFESVDKQTKDPVNTGGVRPGMGYRQQQLRKRVEKAKQEFDPAQKSSPSKSVSDVPQDTDLLTQGNLPPLSLERPLVDAQQRKRLERDEAKKSYTKEEKMLVGMGPTERMKAIEEQYADQLEGLSDYRTRNFIWTKQREAAEKRREAGIYKPGVGSDTQVDLTEIQKPDVRGLDRPDKTQTKEDAKGKKEDIIDNLNRPPLSRQRPLVDAQQRKRLERDEDSSADTTKDTDEADSTSKVEEQASTFESEAAQLPIPVKGSQDQEERVVQQLKDRETRVVEQTSVHTAEKSTQMAHHMEEMVDVLRASHRTQRNMDQSLQDIRTLLQENYEAERERLLLRKAQDPNSELTADEQKIVNSLRDKRRNRSSSSSANYDITISMKRN